jgi:hypothetical protein
LNSALGQTLGNQLSQDVRDAMSTLEESVSFRDWMTSGYTPSDLFKNAASLNSPQAEQDLCTVLINLKPEALVEFESAIRQNLAALDRPAFQCSASLEARIKNYWASEKNNSATSMNSVQTEVKTLKSGTTEISSSDLDPGEFTLVFEGNIDPESSSEILSILQAAKTKAVFLIPGENAITQQSSVKALAGAGNNVGSQGTILEDMSLIPTITASEKLSEGNHILHSLTNSITESALPLFSFPMSADLGSSEYQALEQYTRAQTMTLVRTDLDSEDWKIFNPANLAQNVIEQISSSKKGLILLHGQMEQTVLALPAILNSLAHQNKKLVVFNSDR